MLPFLKKKDSQIAGVVVKHREPDQKPEDQDSPSAGIEECAKALLQAIEAKNIQGIAAAMQDAFSILESQPHEEAAADHSFDSQNEKAAKQE